MTTYCGWDIIIFLNLNLNPKLGKLRLRSA